MKKLITMLAALTLLVSAFSYTVMAEEAKETESAGETEITAIPETPEVSEDSPFITIKEWLEAEGDCGDCLLLLKIKEVLNPVLAVGADETGEINLFSGGENDIILEFGNEERMLTGYWIVIANPRYNEFEGTIEMADWTLLRLMPDVE